MSIYPFIRNILFKLDPENAHSISSLTGKIVSKTPVLNSALYKVFSVEDKSLVQNILGLEFKNPVGLAAGFDKEAKLVDFSHMMGFGFTEIGSLTALSSTGNQKPRLFRLIEDEAIINRMGLNNTSTKKALKNLDSQKLSIPYGVNIAKTHSPSILGKDGIRDIIDSYALANEKSNYVALNISCPNTKEGKTFEEIEALKELLEEIKIFLKENTKKSPLLIKLSSDCSLENLQKIIELSVSYDIDGFIMCNTSTTRENLITSPKKIKSIGPGGLSGKPLFKKSLKRVKKAYEILKGDKLIIGVGGISSAKDAYTFIKSGASLVQVYSSLIYKGPYLVKNINSKLIELIKEDGLENIKDAIGKDLK